MFHNQYMSIFNITSLHLPTTPKFSLRPSRMCMRTPPSTLCTWLSRSGTGTWWRSRSPWSQWMMREEWCPGCAKWKKGSPSMTGSVVSLCQGWKASLLIWNPSILNSSIWFFPAKKDWIKWYQQHLQSVCYVLNNSRNLSCMCSLVVSTTLKLESFWSIWWSLWSKHHRGKSSPVPDSIWCPVWTSCNTHALQWTILNLQPKTLKEKNQHLLY